MSEQARHVSEEASRKVAEESRQTEWNQPSFMREMFLGNFRFDLVHPYPEPRLDRPEFVSFYSALQAFLRDDVDPAAIDELEDYPPEVVEGLRKLGAFGLKIPVEYGGMGFDQNEYAQVMELVGSVDANIMALLSAHQSIGVPQPLKLFGTPDDLKKKYLPRCAKGSHLGIRASPSRMSAPIRPRLWRRPVEVDGDNYHPERSRSCGAPTGRMAELLVVMAMDPQDEEDQRVHRRDRLARRDGRASLPLHGPAGAGQRRDQLHQDVRVPRENLIGKEGQGTEDRPGHAEHRSALTLPANVRRAAPSGVSRSCREWSERARAVGRQPIGKHEAVSHTRLPTWPRRPSPWSRSIEPGERDGRPRRLRHPARGGRGQGVEHGPGLECSTMTRCRFAAAVATRPSSVVGATRRDRADRGRAHDARLARINRIFEGSSEIMHLFMAREAVDKHLQVAGAMIDPTRGPSVGKKMAALPANRWRSMPFSGTRRALAGHGDAGRASPTWGKLAKHLRFIERNAAASLARESFHGMVVYKAALERKQAFLFRLVDIVNELFAMSASVSRATAMKSRGDASAEEAQRLADVFCRSSRRRVDELFRDLWRNEDPIKYTTARGVMDGDFLWMEDLLSGLDEPKVA